MEKTLEMLGGEREEALFWGDYYAQETQNYKKILGEKNFVLKGTEAELAGQFNRSRLCLRAYRRSQYQP